MSLAGPVLSIQPAVSQHTPHPPSLNPMQSLDNPGRGQLLGLPIRRDRASSEGDVHSPETSLPTPISPLATVNVSLVNHRTRVVLNFDCDYESVIVVITDKHSNYMYAY